MIRKIAFALGLIQLFVAAAFPAAARTYKGDIKIIPVRAEQTGDSLYIDLQIDLSEIKVKSNMSADFIPKLESPAWETDLPAISIKGRRNYKAYERGLNLGAESSSERQSTVVRGYGNRDRIVRYTYAIPYESWMDDAQLNVLRYDTGCCNSEFIGSNMVTDSITRNPFSASGPFRPLLVFVQPEAEAVKNRELSAECRLDFLVNKTVINPSYMNNMRELAKIRSIIDELRNDPSIRISSLEIVGYASPEGSLAYNKRLSEGRAMALRNYLASQYDFPASAYSISFGGENWVGLVSALENINMEYKDEVLEIIRTVPIEQGRERRLMNLRGGAPYRYMLKHIFPDLRTAICKIGYSVRGFNAQEALEVFRTRPRDLSLNEFYMVSNMLEKGSPEFIDVFETAVRMYPDDAVANLNAAVVALQNDNIASAERYLERAKTIPQDGQEEYHNAMGVLSWLKGDRARAEAYFRQAEAGGLEEAAINLKLIKTN